MLKNRTTKNIVYEAPHTWKRRPSEIRGYQRAYYITTDEGDYLRVDFNLREKRVRLYVEIESEGGNGYYAIISNGKITAEKSVSTGRSFGFAEKFRERAAEFATIPNREVYKLINLNYGIKKGKSIEESAKAEKKKLIVETKKRYFKKEFYQTGEEDERGKGGVFGNFSLIDFIDFLIGLILSCSAFLFFKYSYMAMGVIAAFFGIIIGFVDMFLRGRSPLLIKVIFFIAAGAILYIYGYFI